jgi:hypothetical protein
MKKYIPLVFIALLSGCAVMNKEECQLADWQAVGYKHGAQGQSATAFNEYQADCAKHNIKADFTAFKRGHQQGLDDFCSYERGLNSGEAGAGYHTQCPSRRYPGFEEGYQIGLARYCSYERGMNAGQVGANYNATCPARSYPAFEEGYYAGLVRYCTYESGYDLGVRGEGLNRNCPDADFPAFSQGHVSGLARYEIEQSMHALEDQLAALSSEIQVHDDFIADSEALIVSKDSDSESRVQALLDIKAHRDERKKLKREYRRIESELAELQMRLNGM